jgi:hypothetical protein
MSADAHGVARPNHAAKSTTRATEAAAGPAPRSLVARNTRRSVRLAERCPVVQVAILSATVSRSASDAQECSGVSRGSARGSPGRDNMIRNGLDEKLIEPATIPPLEPRLENFDQDIRLFPAHRSVDLACRVAEDALA